MVRRVGLIATAAVVAALAIAASAVARPAGQASSAVLTCNKGVTVGMLAPITGPAGSIGADQLHWAQFYFQRWNKVKGHVHINLVQGDTQLDPSKASTVAQQFASNSKIVGVIGPAGSDEVQAVAPILKGYFYRVVPNDGVQGPTDANYMLNKLGVKSGDTVMVVDDQESYSTGLADITGQALSAKGVKVDRESISQKATDFSSLVAKVTGSVKVVFLPFQLASQAQLFAQQLKAQGKSAVVFGSDGTFDSKNFNVEGVYVSFFAPDVTTIPADKSITAAFNAQFPGGTSPFGAPNYVLAQAFSGAITRACKDNKISRAEVRTDFASVNLKGTLLAQPIAFTPNGDVQGAAFHVFKVVNGKYQTVQ